MACEQLRAVERQARARWDEAQEEYAKLVAPFEGQRVVSVTPEEFRAIQEAADRGTAAAQAWIEALKPWLARMGAHIHPI